MTDRTIIANRPANSFARKVIFENADGEVLCVKMFCEGGEYGAGETYWTRKDGKKSGKTPVNAVRCYGKRREKALERFNLCCAIWENHPAWVCTSVRDYIPA